MSRPGRAVAYGIVLFGFLIWLVTMGAESSKQVVLVTLGLAVAGYLAGAAWEKFLIDQRRRKAIRKANREGF